MTYAAWNMRPDMLKCLGVSASLLIILHPPFPERPRADTLILSQAGRAQRGDETISRRDSHLTCVPEGNLHNLGGSPFTPFGLSFPS